jgi:hypothetical protein
MSFEHARVKNHRSNSVRTTTATGTVTAQRSPNPMLAKV